MKKLKISQLAPGFRYLQTLALKLAKVHGSLGTAGLFRAVGLSFGPPDPVASLRQLGDLYQLGHFRFTWITSTI